MRATMFQTPDTENAAVIIYGPQCCGKTGNAKAVADFFGKDRVLDDWKLGDDLPHDAACLTNDERVQGLKQFQMPGYPPSAVFEFSDVMHVLKREVTA